MASGVVSKQILQNQFLQSHLNFSMSYFSRYTVFILKLVKLTRQEGSLSRAPLVKISICTLYSLISEQQRETSTWRQDEVEKLKKESILWTEPSAVIQHKGRTLLLPFWIADLFWFPACFCFSFRKKKDLPVASETFQNSTVLLPALNIIF